MELIPTMTTPTGLLEFIKLVFWYIIHKYISYIQYLIQTLLAFFSTKWEVWNTMKRINSIEKKFSSAEVMLVVEKLGIAYDPDGGSFGAEELSALFEEEEPSLEEVREAFDVFDGNKDGFIDAAELQRVLRSLGLEEVSQLEECKRMINAFDVNGDGLIDFTEFVKFMEISFC